MRVTTFFAIALAAVWTTGTIAAGSSSSSTRSTQPNNYSQGVQAVNAGDYERALGLLRKAVASQPRNADAWNYIGFSHRKRNELDAALTAYNKALAIDPKHRGANEYLGELYIMQGKMDKAKQQLDVLKKACFFGCKEYDDLKAAIRRHTAG